MSGIINSAGSKSGVIGEIGGGVSCGQVFILNADFTTDNTTTTGWIENGNAQHKQGSFGGGISESSGVFTFSKTGKWQVTATISMHKHLTDEWIGFSMKFNNATISDHWEGGTTDSESSVHSITCNHIFDVTSSTDNVRIHNFSMGSGSHMIGLSGWGAGGAHASNVTFVRLRNY